MLRDSQAVVGTGAGGARTLYLGARSHKQVSSSAEALVVRNAEQQTSRYPLARISRVVSSTCTDWSGTALSLCLQAGIGITWMSAKGEALGTCYPRQRTYPQAAVALEMLLETPDGFEQYGAWLRHRRLSVLTRWGDAHSTHITPLLWEATKRDWVYGARLAEHLPAVLLGQCMAYVGAQLACQGLEPELWGPQAQPIALDRDLTHLLWGEMNLLCGNLAAEVAPEDSATVLFERWVGANEAALANHIYSLERIAFKALRQT